MGPSPHLLKPYLVLLVLLAACVPLGGAETTGGPGAAVLADLQNPTVVPAFVFEPLLPFDAIPPVYDPVFAAAGEVPYADDDLVIGVVIEGEAKAYSITVLQAREMVNDELAGIPILVTW